jgi:hypothetical protein
MEVSILDVKNLIFIDSNLYLDLYRMVSAKSLLAPLRERKNYIFVTTQVVNEVQRQKVSVSGKFLANEVGKLKFLANEVGKLKLNGMAAPDHSVSNINAGLANIVQQLREIREKIEATGEEYKSLIRDLLEQVSQSKDEISSALADIFSGAVEASADELERGRFRRERGSPPGKKADTLGDQLSWEQILSQCQGKPRLWIITNDSDFATKHDGKLFLNAALYEELARVYKSQPEVFCFNNMLDGLRHFADKTGTPAQLPTSAETERIKKEQDSLPPLDWLPNYDDGGWAALQASYSAAIRNANLFRDATLSEPVWTGQGSAEDVIPVAEGSNDDKKAGEPAS